MDSVADRYNLLYVIRVRNPDADLSAAESAIDGTSRPSNCDRIGSTQVSLVQFLGNLGNVLEQQDRLAEAGEAYGQAEARLAPIAAERRDWHKVRDNRCNLWQGRIS